MKQFCTPKNNDFFKRNKQTKGLISKYCNLFNKSVEAQRRFYSTKINTHLT